MLGRKTGLIGVGALWCTASLAQANGDDSGKAQQTKELTKAMQNAQLLLGRLSDVFECDYSGYDANPTEMTNKTTYIVVIVVEDETCDDMVRALNYEGTKFNLAFVSKKDMPEMKPLHEPADVIESPPMDRTLIHEVNPADVIESPPMDRTLIHKVNPKDDE